MNKAFFNDIRNEILNQISSAKKEINIAMAWFTNQDLLDALNSRLHKDVMVNLIILDDEINRNDIYGLDFSTFINGGGKLYLSSISDKFLHHKFCIIDSEIIITGSYNWTNYAEYRNDEDIIISDNQHIILLYQEHFHKLLVSKNCLNEYSRIPSSAINKDNYQGCFADFEAEKNLYINNSVLTTSTSILVQNKRHKKIAFSKYNIGFHAYTNGSSDGMKILIEKGTELPVSVIVDAWSNADYITSMPCEIYYGEIKDSILNNSKLVSLTMVVPSKRKGELHFKTKATLDSNGYFHIEFFCVETGESNETFTNDNNLIEYLES